MNYFIFLLGLYGLVRFEAESDLFQPIRNLLIFIPILGKFFFKKVFDCYFCLGFWNASLFLIGYYYPVAITKKLILEGLLLAFGGAAVCFFLHLLENYFSGLVILLLDQSKKMNQETLTSLKEASFLPRTTYHIITHHDNTMVSFDQEN